MSTMHPQARRLQKAMTSLLLRHPFWGSLALQLDVKADPSIPHAACTDGKCIKVHPAKLAELSDDLLPMVVMEEVGHCAMGHLFRSPAGVDWDLWNSAADQEIRNLMSIENMEAMHAGKAPPWVFHPDGRFSPDTSFQGHAAEFIYQELSKRRKLQENSKRPPEPQGKQGQGQSQPQSGAGQGTSPGKPKSTPGQKGQGKSPSQAGGSQGAGSTGNQPSDNSKPSSSLGDFEQPGGLGSSESEREQLRQQWDKAVLQAARMTKGRGHVPACIARRVEEIIHPKSDPFQALREWLTERGSEDFSWMRPNQRYASSGFFLPSLDAPKCGRIVFATDTSGSIDDALLAKMRGLKQWVLDELKPSALVDIYCDAKVQLVAEYLPGDDIGSEAPGGGGTSFRPVFDHIETDWDREEPVRALVYLTDLDGRFPEEEPGYPVVWVTWDEWRTAPFGRVVRVDLEDI